MAIGDRYSVTSKTKIVKLVYGVLGTLDLHTHIRLKPIVGFLKRYLNNRPLNSRVRILELGCGRGLIAWELCKIIEKDNNTDLSYLGVDLSSEAIAMANAILDAMKCDVRGRISFLHDDADGFLRTYKGSMFDIILLVDIIEHVKNPQGMLVLTKKYLKKGGLFLISVPTPLYKRVFGEKFSNKVGHLVDGYTLSCLDKLFNSIGAERKVYKYNTGLFGGVGCWLYYKKLNCANKYLGFLKGLLLYPFRFLDFYNGDYLSCSLSMVYELTNDLK